MWQPDVEEVIVDLLTRPLLFSSVLNTWPSSSLGLTSDCSPYWNATRGSLDSVNFLLRCKIGFKVAVVVVVVVASAAAAFVQTFLEDLQLLESFLEIFLLVSESFRVIFRYNTRPPCLHQAQKKRDKNETT